MHAINPGVRVMSAGLRIIAVVFVSCALPALAAPMGMDDARHLLNRAGFGARPADLAEFSQLSRAAAVERLLADMRNDSGPPAPGELTVYLSPASRRALSDEERRETQKRSAIALRVWWVGAMLNTASPAEQLRETHDPVLAQPLCFEPAEGQEREADAGPEPLAAASRAGELRRAAACGGQGSGDDGLPRFGDQPQGQPQRELCARGDGTVHAG